MAIKAKAKPDVEATLAKVIDIKKSVKGLKSSDVQQMLAQKENQSRDAEQMEEYLHMFTSMRKTIRVFEKELRFNKSTRNVYALMALYSQQRELIADIRSISDHTENVNRILTRIVQPAFSDITQSNLDIFHHIRKLVIEVAKDNTTQTALKRIEDLMREQAKYLQSKYEHASTRLTEIITAGR